MIRVALVDDEAVVRQTVTLLLQEKGTFELTGCYTNAHEALAGLRQSPPDVALIDIGLPDGSGLTLIQTLRPELPNTEFLILTIFDDDHHILEAIMAGASGYLLKGDLLEQLPWAIQTIRSGGSWMSASIARRILTLFQQRLRAPQATIPELRPREREILHLLTQGLSNSEIAEQLHISPETVRTHIRHIYQKLQVRNRAEAVARLFLPTQNHPNG